jgi:hypothetical protein
MVHGLGKFKEYFTDNTSQYVFIGGTACDILMDELGVQFRATKDFDIVLIVEALDVSFGETFWKFILDGGYKHRGKCIGENQYYHFSHPSDGTFPEMIELFSKRLENIELKFDTGLTPIHIDESIVSLSAILLNDLYYDLLLKSKRTVDGLSIVEIETLLLFKIKAWLDMKKRKDANEQVDSKNIKKHKNDIFRLLANVTPSTRVETAGEIKKDIKQFIELINKDKPDLKNLEIKSASFEELIKLIDNIFLQSTEA